MANTTSEVNESGRVYNTDNHRYGLPNDTKEWERLDTLHAAFCLTFEGELVPNAEAVQELLSFKEGYTPKILDIGFGSGIWTISMAKKFPHAEVIGIDLIPRPFDSEATPKNCSFQKRDANEVMEDMYNQFDLIHMRLVASFSDFKEAVEKFVKCLKPGGMLLIIIGDGLYTDDHVSFLPVASEDGSEYSWLQRLIHEVFLSTHLRKIDYEGLIEVTEEKGLWAHPEMQHETCGAGDIFIPMGDWAEAGSEEDYPDFRQAGVLHIKNWRDLYPLFIKILSRVGIPERTLDEWSIKVLTEIDTPTFKSYNRCRVVWGRKRGVDAPASTSFPSIYTPMLITYNDLESFTRAHQEREANKGVLPVTLVSQIEGFKKG